ncbi:enterochelin esterase domain-containing protein [Microbulbifer sp. A4B17]|uniref:enterochelin esterase domain-containing protein n=1 Tax=Microbulbifer sp. A4B17 TaxID=359370 RepID=UPI0013006049|nr:enterochelin esterase domain-containing protein [Microbulbifer sp. A4B17]
MKRHGLPFFSESSLGREKLILTFLWRDLNGSELCSPTKRVFIVINCVKNHHTLSPSSLKRLLESAVWYWQVEIENQCRDSYRLIPTTETWISSNWEKKLLPTDDKHQIQRQVRVNSLWAVHYVIGNTFDAVEFGILSKIFVPMADTIYFFAAEAGITVVMSLNFSSLKSAACVKNNPQREPLR